MDKLAVHTVIDSVTFVLETIGLVPVSVEKCSLEQEHTFFGDIVGSMSLSGVGVDGTLILGFETGTALAVVSAMFGEDYTELDEISKSMIAELANMVCGRVKVGLSEQGYCIGMAIPELYFPGEPLPLALSQEGIHRVLCSVQQGEFQVSVDFGAVH